MVYSLGVSDDVVQNMRTQILQVWAFGG